MIDCKSPIPPTDHVCQSDRPSPVFGEKVACVMEGFLRSWNCRNCGRSNKTVVALDGVVKCEYCTDAMRIQPSRVRGGETPGQLSRPTNQGVFGKSASRN